LPPAVPAQAGAPLAFSLGWRLDANGHLPLALAAPSGTGPRYFLASLGRTVYALGAGGAVRWRARTTGPVYALARLEGNQIAAGDDAGAVTLLDIAGQVLWRYDLSSRVTALQAAPGGHLLAAGWNQRLALLDNHGSLRWQRDLGGPATALALLSSPPGQSLAVAATLDGDLYAYDLEGVPRWDFQAGSPVVALEAAGPDATANLLVALQDGRLLALDAGGHQRWARDLGVGAPVWHISAGGQEILAGAGGARPSLASLSAGDGALQWRIALPSPPGAITTLDLDGDGTEEILAGLASGAIQAYDRRGRLRGAIHAGLPVWGLEATGDGTALALADVVAWQITAGPGPAGGPWLPPPDLVPVPTLVPVPASTPPVGERAGAVLLFLGDVTAGRSVERHLARYGPTYPWSGLETLLKTPPGSDLPFLSIANLEGVLTTRGAPLDKSYLIRAHPYWGEMLRAGGLDLVSLGNNHALDFGPEGLDETLATLDALSISAVGAGQSAAEAHRPVILDVGGEEVAFLAYAAARWNGSVDVPATARLAWAEPDAIRADVQAAAQRAGVVVVLLHAGTEYAAAPSPDQVAAAHAAIDAGADLVVGHHPHVTQTVERYGPGLIVYSLGDAIFDIPRPAAMRGHLLRVGVTGQGLAWAELWPFWIEDAVRPRLLDDGQGAPRFQTIYP
jgi:poly-gamma-glutamate synthesis protein (capsule biosynthesis protein)